jgi:hypothetical protein
MALFNPLHLPLKKLLVCDTISQFFHGYLNFKKDIAALERMGTSNLTAFHCVRRSSFEDRFGFCQCGVILGVSDLIFLYTPKIQENL